MRTWTIQQAIDQVFNVPGFTIPKPTIQDWMREVRDGEGNVIRPRIFRPYKLAERRDPRGSELDMADLVCLMVLRSLSLVGILFKYLSYGDVPGREYMDFNSGSLAPNERPVFQRGMDSGRPIQTFLDLTEFYSFVQVAHSIIGTQQRITFHAGGKLSGSPLLEIHDRAWDPITWINVKPLHEFIMLRVGKKT